MVARGCIYGIPPRRRVLKVVPATGEVTFVGPEFTGKYKWLAPVIALRRAVYTASCHHPTAGLKIVPETGEVTLIGPSFPGALEVARRRARE